MKVLIVVDVQNDFIDGALGSEAAQAIIPNVREKIQKYRESGNYVIFTKDTHDTNYMRSAKGKYLPIPHCIFNTEGWEIEKTLRATDISSKYEIVIDKNTFGETELPSIITQLIPEEEELEEVEFIGLDTDICVISNALICQAYFRKYYPNKFIKITADAACCAGSSPAAHEAALTVMKSCQIEVKE